MIVSTIQFTSKGTVCDGDLYLPDDFDPAGSFPALVIGHGFTVSRSSLAEEGRLFAQAGEPKRLVSLKMDQLDCYKPGYRERTIGAAADFFREYLI